MWRVAPTYEESTARIFKRWSWHHLVLYTFVKITRQKKECNVLYFSQTTRVEHCEPFYICNNAESTTRKSAVKNYTKIASR